VRETYLQVSQKAIIDTLSGLVGETEAEKSINATIKSLKERLNASQDPVMQGLLDKQITMEMEKLKLVPNKANFELILQGNYRDSSWGQLHFESGMMNDHPINNTMMKMIRQNNIAVSQAMLSIQNEHQRQFDKLLKALGISELQGVRSTESFYKPIEVLVSRANTIVEDANGEIVLENGKPKYEYTTQRMLLSEYSPEYIKDATEKKAQIDYYYKKLSDADRNNDLEKLTLYREKLNQAYKERRDFFRENSQNQYNNEILDMYDLLEKEITKEDGTKTTFGRERGYIFEDIEDAEQRREEEIVQEVLDKLQEDIEELHIKQRQLKSKYNEDGTEKTGFEKELSDIANQYAELKTKYGKYEITERGKAMFEKAKLTLQQRLEGGFINEEEYKRRLGEITVTQLSEEYYETVKDYLARIDAISQQLAELPEIQECF
jgi:hypothetical protein